MCGQVELLQRFEDSILENGGNHLSHDHHLVLLLVGGYCIKVGKTTQRLSWAHLFKQIVTLNITTFSEERQLACPAWVYLEGAPIQLVSGSKGIENPGQM